MKHKFYLLGLVLAINSFAAENTNEIIKINKDDQIIYNLGENMVCYSPNDGYWGYSAKDKKFIFDDEAEGKFIMLEQLYEHQQEKKIKRQQEKIQEEIKRQREENERISKLMPISHSSKEE